ncbi:hypothetical protein ACFE04_018739 [Oxalis oulophora]
MNNYYPSNFKPRLEPSPLATSCPDYFRWIYEDLKPWKGTGITRDMIDKGKNYSHFSVLIVNGKLFVQKYRQAFQSRDVFTIWSILQLLRLYPGEVPNLELLFNCDDESTVVKPPLPRTKCRVATAKVKICPWESMLKKIKKGSKKIKWKDRVPYAYWKGNPLVAQTRQDLIKCTPSKRFDWNARLYVQNSYRESRRGFKTSNLEDQCTHLSLVPMKHFWPIRNTDKCRDIKFAVEWGNNHTVKAQEIGEQGSRFIEEQLQMGFVYDYMLHLLREYAKLLKFKPKIIPNKRLVEVCVETMACHRRGLEKKYMVESMVKAPSDSLPCVMPPTFDPVELQDFLGKQENVSRKVESWGNEYWKNTPRLHKKRIARKRRG